MNSKKCTMKKNNIKRLTMIKIHEIVPIRIEYNAWNGFMIIILGIEIQGENKGFTGELFGLHFAANFLIVNLLFFEFEIKSPID